MTRESWNSRGGVEDLESTGRESVVIVDVGGSGTGVTTSSRHWGTLEADGAGVWISIGPERPGRDVELGVAAGEGATDWKAWMGRASKNSWAIIKGVLRGSNGGLSKDQGIRAQIGLPLGRSRMSSHQATGRSEYLLLLRKPMSISSMGASSPQSRRFCVSRRDELASIK